MAHPEVCLAGYCMYVQAVQRFHYIVYMYRILQAVQRFSLQAKQKAYLRLIELSTLGLVIISCVQLKITELQCTDVARISLYMTKT